MEYCFEKEKKDFVLLNNCCIPFEIQDLFIISKYAGINTDMVLVV